MKHLNIEIKAKCTDLDRLRIILKNKNADFKGMDHQIDTYFQVSRGRLKVRKGNIENALIYYSRENEAGPKAAHVMLHEIKPESSLTSLLAEALGVLVTVDKRREIYFLENVKIHLDEVRELGSFVEIEAIDLKGNIGKEHLLKQCHYYLNLFGIQEADLVSVSYSDLLMAAGSRHEIHTA